MSKGGYDKLLKKLQESNVENLRLQNNLVASERAIAELRKSKSDEDAKLEREHVEASKASRLPKKIAALWNSHPAWGAIGVLLGILFEHLSRLLLFVGVWAVLLVEIIRIGFFRSRLQKWIGIPATLLILSGIFFGIWIIAPPPQEKPLLDTKIGSELDAILHNTEKGSSPIVVTTPPPPEHTHVHYLSIPQIGGAYLHQPPPTMLPESALTIPIGFKNAGDFPVESTASSFACIPITTDDPNTAFNRVRKTFTFSVEGGTLQPHTDDILYQTISCAVLTDEMIKQFFAKKLVFCGFGAVKWKDKSGRYETDFGQCLVAEPDGKNWNWHSVPQTDQEKKLE
jgi:hypothetical protein